MPRYRDDEDDIELGSRRSGGGRRSHRGYDDDDDFADARYEDDLVFDSLKHSLPDPFSGPSLLRISFFCQVAVVVLGFVGHHYKQPEFGCCNLWAVLVAIFVIFLQSPYYNEWGSKLGQQPEWHRANVFVPFLVFLVFFVMWVGGTLSMFAHSTGSLFFDFQFGGLNDLEKASFFLATLSFLPLALLLVVLAVTHRTNLGMYYYLPQERRVEKVVRSSDVIVVRGSFNYRNMLGLLARGAGVETSASAEAGLPRVQKLVAFLYVVFYVWLGISYGEGRKGAFLITVICLGAVTVLAKFAYFFGDASARKTRAWNRAHLFYPIHQLIISTALYVFAMSAMFFQGRKNVWEDIAPELDATETGLFVASCVLLAVLYGVQWLLANLHRKAWAAATEMGSFDDPREKRFASSGREFEEMKHEGEFDREQGHSRNKRAEMFQTQAEQSDRRSRRRQERARRAQQEARARESARAAGAYGDDDEFESDGASSPRRSPKKSGGKKKGKKKKKTARSPSGGGGGGGGGAASAAARARAAEQRAQHIDASDSEDDMMVTSA